MEELYKIQGWIGIAQDALNSSEGGPVKNYLDVLESLEEDAERYRWLRDGSNDQICVVNINYWSDEYRGQARIEILEGQQLDNDIDTASVALSKEA